MGHDQPIAEVQSVRREQVPGASARACTAGAAPDSRWASMIADGSTATTRRLAGS